MTDTEPDVEEDDDGEGEKSDIIVIPTSHASESGTETIHQAIQRNEPDVVAVELDEQRAERLLEKKHRPTETQASPIETLRQNRRVLGFKGAILMLMFGRIQSMIADKLGIDVVGLDMLAGYEAAEDLGVPVALVDRDIQTTVNRFSDAVSTRELLAAGSRATLGLLHLKRSSASEVEQQVQADNIDIAEVLDELDDVLPTFRRVFIDERDEILAENARQLAETYGTVALVIGAGHEPGVVKSLNETEFVSVKTAP